MPLVKLVNQSRIACLRIKEACGMQQVCSDINMNELETSGVL